MSNLERTAALEVKVDNLTDEVAEMREDIKSLLALKHKGVGAFWLASALMGSGIIGFLTMMYEWIKG